jgi:hypothetical protein
VRKSGSHRFQGKAGFAEISALPKSIASASSMAITFVRAVRHGTISDWIPVFAAGMAWFSAALGAASLLVHYLKLS